MKSSYHSIGRPRNDRPKLLILCLLFSLLLHLLIVYTLTLRDLSSETMATEQQPTIVQLVDKPPAPQPKEYELDQQPTQPAPEPPPESSRLAEQNQIVEKEMAPEGEDSRDQSARPAQRQAPQAAPTPPQRSVNAAEPTPPLPTTQTSAGREQAADRPKSPAGKLSPRGEEKLPSLEKLTQLAPDTLQRIAKNEQAVQEKIKQREDLETGDTVWLNLERGLLISFFRRFRNQIEGVWNYPREAIEKEQQGTLLLKITVDTEGKLLDVDLLRSSGSDILDYEAIQAVYRASPFGPLGRHYPYPDLKIMAHFRYTISGKYIYGRRR